MVALSQDALKADTNATSGEPRAQTKPGRRERAPTGPAMNLRSD